MKKPGFGGKYSVNTSTLLFSQTVIEYLQRKELVSVARRLKSLISAMIFLLIGVLAGYVYYTRFPCPTGTCVITSSVWSTMAYTGLIGLLLGYVLSEFKK